MRYRKKPVVVDAIQLTDHDSDILAFMSDHKVPFEVINDPLKDPYMIIHTIEGDMFANHDDWIIKGVKGEFYPCKPDIFEETYELAEEE